MYQIKRTDEEINKVLEWVYEGTAEGSHYTGMSYEEGIEAFWMWLIGDTEEDPTE